MPAMENAEIARLLAEMADIHEIEGGSPFRVRALRGAADTVEAQGLSVLGLARSGGVKRLKELAGIGEGIAKRIVEIAETGKLEEYEELTERTPRSLIELLEIPGIGPKKVKLFREELGIKDLDDLEAAAKAEKLRELPRLGAKSEKKIIEAIERHRQHSGRFLLVRGEEVMARLVSMLRGLDGVERVEPAGSLRRRRETVGDLDILCICSEPEPVMDRFAREGEGVIGRGSTKCSIRMPKGLNVDLRILPRESFGAALHYFTGSKAHNVALRTLAQKRGLTVSEYGVFEAGSEERKGGEREEDVFAAVGLAWVPPELRENTGEIEAAREGRLPTLIEVGDLAGDLHMHTSYTDGATSVRAMAEAALERGRSYIAFTDHSKALAMTGGLDEERLREQGEEIRSVQEEIGGGIRLLRGIEVDILRDGSLDLAEDALGELDVVVGSIHSHFELPREEMTSRILKALQSGVVDILGHPTGRILRRREPYPFDLEAVLGEAARLGVAMEISASPYRLDLSDHNCRLASKLGVKLVISTDAHRPAELDLLGYGIDVARRGWLEKGDVLNTIRDPGAFVAALHEGHR